MLTTGKKGLKPFLIKKLALVMGICYLANPLQSQIGLVFHEISHLIDAPDSFLFPHSTSSAHGEVDHHYHEHDHIDVYHEHELVDFFTSLFEASDEESSPEETVLTDIKFDKHTKTENYNSKVPIISKKRIKSTYAENSLGKGFFKRLKKPPKNLPYRYT